MSPCPMSQALLSRWAFTSGLMFCCIVLFIRNKHTTAAPAKPGFQ